MIYVRKPDGSEWKSTVKNGNVYLKAIRDIKIEEEFRRLYEKGRAIHQNMINLIGYNNVYWNQW